MKYYCILAFMAIALTLCAGCSPAEQSEPAESKRSAIPAYFPSVERKTKIWEFTQTINPLFTEKAFDGYWVANVFNDYGIRGDDLAKCNLLENDYRVPILFSTPPTGFGGRSSDILSGQIYFSTSDGSDPSINGRSYELECRQEAYFYKATVLLKNVYTPFSIYGNPDAPSIPLKMTWKNLDENSSIIPNLRLAGRPDISSLSHIVNSIIYPGMTDEEKVVAIWEFVYNWRYHWYSFNFDYPEERFDPVKAINVYGYGYCGGTAHILITLCNHLGFPTRVVQIEGVHAVAEVYYEGSWHMFDADIGNFFRKQNGEIADLSYIVENEDIIKQTLPLPFPYNFQNMELKNMYIVNGSYDIEFPYFPPNPHVIDPALYPNTIAVFNFLGAEKYFKDLNSDYDYPPPWFANGKLTQQLNGQNVLSSGRFIEIEENWPYVILGSDLELNFGQLINKPAVYISSDKTEWTEISCQSKGDEIFCNTDAWFDLNGKPIYKYIIVVDVGDGIAAEDLSISGSLTTTFQFAPRAIAHVNPGRTDFEAHIEFPDQNSYSDFKGAQLDIEWFTPIRTLPMSDNYDFSDMGEFPFLLEPSRMNSNR